MRSHTWKTSGKSGLTSAAPSSRPVFRWAALNLSCPLQATAAVSPHFCGTRKWRSWSCFIRTGPVLRAMEGWTSLHPPRKAASCFKIHQYNSSRMSTHSYWLIFQRRNDRSQGTWWRKSVSSRLTNSILVLWVFNRKKNTVKKTNYYNINFTFYLLLKH